jgi:nicotinate-nucleotide--dimethylbenzimidazole phosphoribosyltransferase
VPVGVIDGKAGFGTANLAREAAMTDDQLAQCLAQGRLAVQRALAAGADLFIGGEMGIGNTTPAAALGCALLGLPGAPSPVPAPGWMRPGYRTRRR